MFPSNTNIVPTITRIFSAGKFLTSAMLLLGMLTMAGCESATELDTPSKRNPSVISPIETQVNVLVSEFVHGNQTDNWMWNHDAARKVFTIDTLDGETICTADLQLVNIPANSSASSLVSLSKMHLRLERMQTGTVKSCFSTHASAEDPSFIDLKYHIDLNGQATLKDHLEEFVIEMQEVELPDDFGDSRQVEITFSTAIQGSVPALSYELEGTISLKF